MAQSSRQAGTPKLELQPGRDGTALELTERQQLLIRLQHPDAARVVVMELHGGASAAALERPSRRVLQTVGLNGSGQPEEPTLTKLDAAAELVEEVARHDAVAEALGPYAGRILRRPLYLRDASGQAASEFSALEHTADADAALVLELPGACWALPEFSGANAGRQIIAPVQAQLCAAVAEGKESDCATIDETLNELCATRHSPLAARRPSPAAPTPPAARPLRNGPVSVVPALRPASSAPRMQVRSRWPTAPPGRQRHHARRALCECRGRLAHRGARGAQTLLGVGYCIGGRIGDRGGHRRRRTARAAAAGRAAALSAGG